MIVKLTLKNSKEGETVYLNIHSVTHIVDIGDGCVRLYTTSGLKIDAVVPINDITAIWDGALFLSKDELNAAIHGEMDDAEIKIASEDGTITEDELEVLLTPGNSNRLHVNYARALAGKRQ